ncbi:hypothetical protein [Cupriavidus basilensis]|uniref:hypothetical protein n=1 Tax=Cupriavidus basilensis TaxID=68895 RepID=UPI0039F707C9
MVIPAHSRRDAIALLAAVLGEPPGRPLPGAMAMIVGGVALGIWHPAGAPPRPSR